MPDPLDILAPTFGYATQSGKITLKGLQNDALPLADLLVREAIQNSSDAAIDYEKNLSKVAFNTGTFDTRGFNGLLSGITEQLDERYPQESAQYLEIRDGYTSGLTGPLRASDVVLSPEDHGNYFKLIFESGREQTNSDSGQAGGSWGYGKAVYYLAGIGIVLFYSRIHEPEKGDDCFSSRLIVALVERDDTKHSLLKQYFMQSTGLMKSIGLAWWGQRDEDHPDDILPITDEGRISEILSLFSDVEEFEADETGTSIIIPYIAVDRLLNGVIPEDDFHKSEIAACTFKDDLDEYLKLAIQRWYAPRLFNTQLDKLEGYKWLRASVNDEVIRTDNMRRLFLLVQELYNDALFNNKGLEYKSKEFPGIRHVVVPSNFVTGNLKIANGAGTVSFVEVAMSDIGMGGDTENVTLASGVSPWTLMRLFDSHSRTTPIVMFARTPGLIHNYTADGEWLRMDRSDENSLFLAFFVPDCNSLLSELTCTKLEKVFELPDERQLPLGEYLRRCEKPDHMGWEDMRGLTIVKNLKLQVNNKVNAYLNDVDDVEDSGSISRFAGFLGSRLLPSTGYGKKRGETSASTRHTKNFGARSTYELELLDVGNTRALLRFRIALKPPFRKAAFGFLVETDSGSSMAPDTWKRDIATEFPLQLMEIRECKSWQSSTGEVAGFDRSCTVETPVISSGLSTVRMVVDNGKSKMLGFSIEQVDEGIETEGTLVLDYRERHYSFDFKELAIRGDMNE